MPNHGIILAMNDGQNLLIRVLPACLTEPLPSGWDHRLEGYVVEMMPMVEHPAAVSLSLTATEPDILLVDGDFPDLDLPALIRAAHKARPGVAVVALATGRTHTRVHQALLAGVEDFLKKPVSAEELRSVLLSFASRRTLRTATTSDTPAVTSRQGRVVGVISGKGGLGKTTIATNLAVLMAKSKQKAALIGFESGDSAVLLGVQPKLGLMDMIDALATRDTAGENHLFDSEWMTQYATPHRSGLNYWTWKGGATTEMVAVPEHFIGTLAESCRASFDYTFIDFPILSEEEFTVLLPLLDVVLVISSLSDLLALRATKSLLDMVLPEYRRRVRLVINQTDPQDAFSKDDFEDALNFRITAMLPNSPQTASSAINLGAPFVLTQQPTELSNNMKSLAEQLFRLPAEKEENMPKSSSLFSWLKG